MKKSPFKTLSVYTYTFGLFFPGFEAAGSCDFYGLEAGIVHASYNLYSPPMGLEGCCEWGGLQAYTTPPSQLPSF